MKDSSDEDCSSLRLLLAVNRICIARREASPANRGRSGSKCKAIERKDQSAECYTVQVDAAPAFPGSRSQPSVGEWLSLVEHLVRDQGVGGSNPLSPTNLFSHINCVSGLSSASL